MIYELTPRYDGRQSFYRKAMVHENEGSKDLVSYDTTVAQIKDGVATVFGTYSQTTLRHIKEFLLQNGFNAENKQQIVKDYMGGKE